MKVSTLNSFPLVLALLALSCKPRMYNSRETMSQTNDQYPNLATCSQQNTTCPISLDCTLLPIPADFVSKCVSKEDACKSVCRDRPCHTKPTSFEDQRKGVWCSEDPIESVKIVENSSIEIANEIYSKNCSTQAVDDEMYQKISEKFKTSVAKDEEYKDNQAYSDMFSKIPLVSLFLIGNYSVGLALNVNKWLWTGETPSNYKCTYVARYALAKALALIPHHSTLVYRGSASFFRESVGSEFVFKGFMSTSRKLSVAYSFSPAQVWKIRKSHSGRWISPLAAAGTGEDEVLFPPLTKLKVVSIENDATVEGMRITQFITLDEVE